jgi:O-antigen/teichoic acid export membrane protein
MAARVTRMPGIRWLWSFLGSRGRIIASTAAWSLAARLAGVANLFVAVPFVLHALGPAQFGAWATLVSLVYFAGFLDFGFGNGTMNLVAAAHGRGDPGEVAVILRESRRALTRIAAGLALGVLVALPLVPWHRLLGLPADMASVCRDAAAAVLFTIVLAVPLNLANRVQLGLGRGDRAYQWQVAGQVLSMALVIWLCRTGASLPAITAAAVATPLVASIANTLQLHGVPWKWAAAPRTPRDRDIATLIRKEGTLFFVLQLTAALAFSADLPLISSLGGPDDAGRYAVVQRMFSVVPLSLALVWTPLWPAYRHALASANVDWAVRTLRRSVLLASLAAACGAFALAFGAHAITRVWLKQDVAIDGLLLGGFVAWTIVEAAGTAIATFLNAASVLRLQVIICGCFATTCLGGKALAMLSVGYAALPLVTTLSYVLTVLVPIAVLMPRIIARIRSEAY